MTISFNKSIYPLKAIKKTIRVYKNLAKFKITEKNNYFIIELSRIDKEVENIIKDEFGNYVLSRVRQ
ncbi:HxsD-like protein [Patescibacteria group bacterium]|nr:HxsD-like protein [Patescibacteria group bacterium]MBU1499807.1 HxsD-like protein [Patescibacteria group bacterium]